MDIVTILCFVCLSNKANKLDQVHNVNQLHQVSASIDSGLNSDEAESGVSDI